MKFFKSSARLMSLLLLVIMLSLGSAFAREEDPLRYVVTLETSNQPFKSLMAVNLPLSEASRIYTTSFRRGGVTWYRLRLGFFGSRHEAEEILSGLRSQYPSAWATRISKREKRSVVSGKIKSQLATIVAAGK